MQKEKLQITSGWKLMWKSNQLVRQSDCSITTYEEICISENQAIDATVPGNVELDMMRASLLPDLFPGINMERERDLEYLHFWYGCRFNYNGPIGEMVELVFDGIDTFSEIYLNGQLVGKTDNMFISHSIKPEGLRKGENELVVHILPVDIVARSLPSTPMDYHNMYNYASLRVRKATYMFGWDIMPRAISAGIWRDVFTVVHEEDEIEEWYLYTSSVSSEKDQAELALYFRAKLSQDQTSRYSIRIEGRCGSSTFSQTYPLWFSNGKYRFKVESPKVWNPVGYGDPNLYDISLTLLLDNEPVDVQYSRLGIRTVELVRSSYTDEERNGYFHFLINGKRIYVQGTNWAPTDVYPSRMSERVIKALDLVREVGCNTVRCWGGNIYEDHEFFDYCDEHGILVWEDFSMACAIHPNEPTLKEMLRVECTAVVKKLRQHPSLVLWSGDNECDVAFSDWIEIRSDPNLNELTREVIPAVLRAEDPARPYLPSSPYVDEELYKLKNNRFLPENHLWGPLPRNNFKSQFYKESLAHFVSEIGFYGSVSPESARQFLSPDCMWPPENREWMIHCSPPESGEGQYSFRRQVMMDQVSFLFGSVPQSFDGFALASQIVQAEALKFFIELFRMNKPRTSGMIWWNLIDGWPQLSDAVVDYYFRRKLSFFHIQRSQAPLCIMASEPVDQRVRMQAVSDLPMDLEVSYEIFDVSKNRKWDKKSVTVKADAVTLLDEINVGENAQGLYHIVWEAGNYSGENHYLLGEPPFSFNDVVEWLRRAGVLCLEGFDLQN